MSSSIAAHIPIPLAEKFIDVFREYRLLGEAESLTVAIQKEKKAIAERIRTRTTRFYSDDQTEGSVYIRLPGPDEVEDPDFFQQIAKILYGQQTKHVRQFYMECTRMATVLTSVDPQIPKLDNAPEAMRKYLNANCKLRGWLYGFEQDDQGNEVVVAYLPVFVDVYHPREDAPYMRLKCLHNGAKGDRNNERPMYQEMKCAFTWTGSQCTHSRVSEALRSKNLYAETQALQDEYDAQLARFEVVRAKHNELFRCVGYVEKCSGGWRDKGYWGTEKNPAMIVNDESLVTHTPAYQGHSEIYAKRPGVGGREGVHLIPFHPYVYGFDLARHEEVWVHVSNCTEYQYLEIADKLVLPDSHAELVDAVVHDLGFVKASDIVGDKGTGTPVLSIGKPGGGKTLLAEVVSHRMKRPLYKINAGYLLGDEDGRVANVENALQAMLQRSERQKLIPLIDEADVMIATRQASNLTQAAVVAAFLRTLEYFNGLLFLTSNRADIDDAILSRMAAVIRFRSPTEDERFRIWKIQVHAQEAKMPVALMEKLAKIECSGRDINRLLSLALRYLRAGKVKELDYGLFCRIAAYRGIEAFDGSTGGEDAPRSLVTTRGKRKLGK